MSHHSANIDDFGMGAGSLSGPLEARLDAVSAAGFTQVMLSAHDLASHPGAIGAAVAAVRASGLRVTGMEVLRDYEGLSGRQHDYKIDIAKTMLEMCQAVGCRLLLVRSSTLQQAASETAVLIRDLRKLAMLAIPLNIKIAYQAVAQACSVRQFVQAWDLVCEADMPNLGLALGADAVCADAWGNSLDELELLEPDKIFLVQLADFMWGENFRVFPGEGCHSEAVAALVTRLYELGYRRDFSLDVLNADYRQLSRSEVAQRAWRSALWLGEGVLQRSVPLPNHIRLQRTPNR